MARRRSTSARRAGQEPRSGTRPLAFVVFGLGFLLLFLWMHQTAGDRSWEEYVEAGDRALERGNYEWAEKMYREALQFAQQKDPGNAQERKTLQRLSRLYQTQGKTDRARDILRELRQPQP